ncbi:MAG: hypothetical protein J0H73_14860 [Salana multivorans]|uniref:DUF1175 family protein n=1 Tax=Salana multivorans TaxID=120377 RepID=UPI0009674B83|nr:DUF1175 family protein [Salana multivorans]MBN8883579.1 hypothetical protein [Salana multivorans]OJX93930.1 MAG: hypothetical protein BGO96_00235 [Micrococcales bacterium 73-15]
MSIFTRAEWRSFVRDAADAEGHLLTEKEVRDCAGLLAHRYEAALDERPGDWSVDGTIPDPTPATAFPNAAIERAVVNAAAARRRITTRRSA